jgi:hypothetical protein
MGNFLGASTKTLTGVLNGTGNWLSLGKFAVALMGYFENFSFFFLFEKYI